MTKKSVQLFVAATLLAASFLTFSFGPKPKEKAKGGGIAGGVHFNFTAVENSSGTVGHFTWDGMTYDIQCVYVSGNMATIYLDNGMAVDVTDSKSGDIITSQYLPEEDNIPCNAATTMDVVTQYSVTEGNLTVHK